MLLFCDTGCSVIIKYQSVKVNKEINFCLLLAAVFQIERNSVGVTTETPKTLMAKGQPKRPFCKISIWYEITY